MRDRPFFNLEPLNLRIDGKKPGLVSLVAYRARVSGGWLVALLSSGVAMAFYPDPEHTWDGGTLDIPHQAALPIPSGEAGAQALGRGGS
jgi:hypothetical protein